MAEPPESESGSIDIGSPPPDPSQSPSLDPPRWRTDPYVANVQADETAQAEPSGGVATEYPTEEPQSYPDAPGGDMASSQMGESAFPGNPEFDADGAPSPNQQFVPPGEINKVGPQRLLLGEIGGVECWTVIWATPWTGLGLDALVVPVGPRGPDAVGSDLLSAVPLAQGAVDLASQATPSSPAVFEIPRDGSVPPEVTIERIIVANANEFDPDDPDTLVGPPTLEAAGTAAFWVINGASLHGARSVGVPLIGAEGPQPDITAIADAVVSNVKLALGSVRSDALTQVVFLAESPPERDAIEQAFRGFDSPVLRNDRPRGPDLLGIRAEVHALADMLLLRKVDAPLAVGVLGGWGSGKSFVMGLLQERLHELRAEQLDEGDAWDGPSPSPFVGHVYPIEFNAWTYARADLWAGLMFTVLYELDRQLGIERRLMQKDGNLRDGAKWDRVWRLPDELRELYEATDLPDQTGTDLFQALTNVHAADQEALEHKQAELVRLRDEQAAKERAVTDEVDDALRVDIDDARWSPFRALVGSAVGATSAEVGKWIDEQVPQLKEVRAGAEGSLADARQITKSLRDVRPPVGTVAKQAVRQHWIAAGVFLVATAAVAAVALLVDTELSAAQVPGLVATAVAGLAAFGRVVGSGLAAVRKVTDRLTAWQGAVNEEITRLEVARPERIAQALAADETVEGARTQVELAEAEVERLKARVQLVGEFRSVSDLVDARLKSGDYQQRLGVMQQISDDLRSLSESLRVGPQDVHANQKKKELFPRGPARVVLFIDDLDRCPPDKVVEVLEAVQLLLATDLFVVVMAIDVRYVTKALEKVYRGVLSANGDPSGIDYLEKILQIPYRTRIPDAAAVQRFLAGQMDVEAPVTPATAPVTPGGPGATSETRTVVPEVQPTAQFLARQLTFSPDELAVLTACCASLELTPRATKRVSNVAKLFRLVWAREGKPRPNLEETAAVALLVGLAAAHPEVQRDALDHLAGLVNDPASRQLSVADALRDLPPPPPPAPGTSNPTMANYERWRAAVDAVVTPPMTSAAGAPLHIGEVRIGRVGRAVGFVAAFCFVGDPQT